MDCGSPGGVGKPGDDAMAWLSLDREMPCLPFASRRVLEGP